MSFSLSNGLLSVGHRDSSFLDGNTRDFMDIYINGVDYFTHFNQEVMHALQNLWPHEVSTGSLSQLRQIAHSYSSRMSS